ASMALRTSAARSGSEHGRPSFVELRGEHPIRITEEFVHKLRRFHSGRFSVTRATRESGVPLPSRTLTSRSGPHYGRLMLGAAQLTIEP
ncbi:MAG TPA: hypothetical protein VFQ61_04815, partial [Polyangiaceae bacterium]|nr:hypothetical protein [Polyangiaceae bacterium]